MKLANHDGRAVLVTSDTSGLDLEAASQGRFGPDIAALYDSWEEVAAWAKSLGDRKPDVTIDRTLLGCPSPSPRQIVAVGLNYHAHARESGFASPQGIPPTFTKFASALTGPDTTVVLPSEGHTDWEVELVVIIGRETSRTTEEDAWSAVAGLAVGQDLSERILQLSGPAPQFGLGKSYAGFAPVGPWLVTPDEVPNRDDLELGCTIDGETVQKGRTTDLIFPVATLISRLSQVITLQPGDLVFTGTPAGVGQGRTPQRFLQAGERLVSWIAGIGELHQTFVAEEA